MPATFQLEVWGRIMETEMAEMTKIQTNRLKQIFHLPKSLSNTEILIETGIWPVKERLEWVTMMMYHSIMNNDDERIAKKILKEQ